MKKHTKDFEGWNKEKQITDRLDAENIFFKEREIWWCKVGVNVGFEIDGKKNFRRPVLILRKLSHHTFIGIPLTKRNKGGIKRKGIERFYFKLGEIKDKRTNEIKDDLLSLQQMRVFDKRRLISRKYRLKEKTFNEIRKRVKRLI